MNQPFETRAAKPRAGAAPAGPTRAVLLYALRRLREPSTYAGLAAALAGCGLFGLGEREWSDIFALCAALAGVAAMLLSDRRGARD
jgi:hypothetical protein